MTENSSKPLPTTLYQEDIVKRDETNAQGIIVRCWHDLEDPPIHIHNDPLMRRLEQGEVGVSYFPTGAREIIAETSLTLIDRHFQQGDFCKRSIDDVWSGVITSVTVKGKLVHAITGEPVEGWKGLEDLDDVLEPDIGCYVIHDDWVGQIIDVFDECLVEVPDGSLLRLPELSSRLTVGDMGDDILPAAGGIQGIFGAFLGHNQDTVISVKHTVIAVCWLALNQSLEPEELQAKSRPKSYWHGSDLSKLTLVQRLSDRNLQVGDKVTLENAKNLPVSVHGKGNDPNQKISVQCFLVKETCSYVDVLWQDGRTEHLKATEIIPYLSPDEYDCWPGDHVVWKVEGESRLAVVQSVNAVERIASINFLDLPSPTPTTVSVLEIDPSGIPPDGNELNDSLSLGVHLGDFVFVHKEGTSNGIKSPWIPKIGEIEPWVREVGISPDGQVFGWRNELCEIGLRVARERTTFDRGESEMVKNPRIQGLGLKWFGEVVGCRVDGSVEVAHPDGCVESYPLDRLTKLNDSVEQLEDSFEEYVHDSDFVHQKAGEGDKEFWTMNQDGLWHSHDSTNDNEEEWEEMSNVDEAVDDEMVGIPEDTDDMPGLEPVTIVPLQHSPGPSPRPLSPSQPPSIQQQQSLETSAGLALPLLVGDVIDGDEIMEEDIGEAQWKKFDVLPSAPMDHAFYSAAPANPSKAFLGRLAKEYKALTSSLPDCVIVRTYEDRTDLLRSIIIGPENTPYEDAPFAIDWMLESSYPQSPPKAHFHSWTNGNGRVNPNLYEEGKVCLSILGTWAGDRNETWNASRSSLLQAFVSIQGLVLVKEPWFCEPAFEKLRGTEEGMVNSRLYSEKAYVLSRGFIRRALEIPLGGLEAELNKIYYVNGRLSKVLRDSRSLINKSMQTPSGSNSKGNDEISREEQDLAIPRLTAGGIIALERTLGKLQVLMDAQLQGDVVVRE